MEVSLYFPFYLCSHLLWEKLVYDDVDVGEHGFAVCYDTVDAEIFCCVHDWDYLMYIKIYQAFHVYHQLVCTHQLIPDPKQPIQETQFLRNPNKIPNFFHKIPQLLLGNLLQPIFMHHMINKNHRQRIIHSLTFRIDPLIFPPYFPEIIKQQSGYKLNNTINW